MELSDPSMFMTNRGEQTCIEQTGFGDYSLQGPMLSFTYGLQKSNNPANPKVGLLRCDLNDNLLSLTLPWESVSRNMYL